MISQEINQLHLTEENDRKELIDSLLHGGKEYIFGQDHIRYTMTVQSQNSANTVEVGEVLMEADGQVIAHVRFTLSREYEKIFIQNKGYGAFDAEDNKEIRKKYEGRGIVSHGTALIAEYGIYNQSKVLAGIVHDKNVASKNSRLKMRRVIGNMPFIHVPEVEDDPSSELHTLLRS